MNERLLAEGRGHVVQRDRPVIEGRANSSTLRRGEKTRARCDRRPWSAQNRKRWTLRGLFHDSIAGQERGAVLTPCQLHGQNLQRHTRVLTQGKPFAKCGRGRGRNPLPEDEQFLGRGFLLHKSGFQAHLSNNRSPDGDSTPVNERQCTISSLSSGHM